MPIQIRRVEGGYVAEVTPPHGNGSNWRTPGPLERNDLISELRGLGCHETDIGDAFYGADPDWLSADPGVRS